MQKGIAVLSMVLLVKPEHYSTLFRVSIFESAPFKVWKDKDDVKLFWTGRKVEKLYSMSALSFERWWSVPIPDAAESLLKHGKAKRVKSEPTPEGELPR